MARSARVDEALNVLAAAAVTVAVGTTLLVIAVLIGNLVGLNQLAVAGILLAGYAWGRLQEMSIKDRRGRVIAGQKPDEPPLPPAVPVPSPPPIAPVVAAVPRTTRHCIEVAITHLPDGSVRIERIGEQAANDRPG